MSVIPGFLLEAGDFITPALQVGNPDIWFCRPQYGVGLAARECIDALVRMPHGDIPVEYSVDGPVGGDHTLPWSARVNDCEIKIEIAGPPPRTRKYSAIPDVLRGVAAWVLGKCVVEEGGYGGYATMGFRGLYSYVQNPSLDRHSLWPASTSYITITLMSRSRSSSNTGDVDPLIPLHLHLAQIEAHRYYISKDTSPFYQAFLGMSRAMGAGEHRQPWWQHLSLSPSPPNQMTYACDANLGSPPQVDCSRLEYSQLGAPSDTLAIIPGVPKVLFSQVCTLALSSPIPITITWAHVSAALEALIGICISTPGKGTGGRAYYAAQGTVITKRGRKQRMDSRVSVSNALPPHVNLTLYQTGHFVPE